MNRLIEALAASRSIADDVEEMMADSLSQGKQILLQISRSAMSRLIRNPDSAEFFNPQELNLLAGVLAILASSADRLARGIMYDLNFRVAKKELRNEIREGMSLPYYQQEKDYSCGAACVRSLLDHFQIPETEPRLRKLLGTDPKAGTLPEEIIALLEAFGLIVDARDNLTPAELHKAINADCPVICCCQMHGGGHWVVIEGMDENGLDILDPSEGHKKLSYKSWDSIWHDTDINGNFYDHFGIAVSPPLAESRMLEDINPTITPLNALRFFMNLTPSLDPVPIRAGAILARQTFTLAAATNQRILLRVKNLIADRLKSGLISTGAKALQALLDDAGLSPRNPQYAEMVFRTNIMDSYTTSAAQELSDRSETFPVWKYFNPDDSRSREHHAEKNGQFYPSSVPFADVRGTDIADVANCRCVPIPVWWRDWIKLRSGGATIADGYTDPVPPTK